ncbi:hypothetical protein T261_8201 [Streptomyces lydicus]|nr:hypothetical protein T261_8201 [Streptomyces lydicus]
MAWTIVAHLLAAAEVTGQDSPVLLVGDAVVSPGLSAEHSGDE